VLLKYFIGNVTEGAAMAMRTTNPGEFGKIVPVSLCKAISPR
jgi:hypothetical protein